MTKRDYLLRLMRDFQWIGPDPAALVRNMMSEDAVDVSITAWEARQSELPEHQRVKRPERFANG